MNISKLEEGMVIKNYKALCELLGVECKKGNSRISTLKELDTYILYHKVGQKYFIDTIYKKPKSKFDGRINNGSKDGSTRYTDFMEYEIDKINDKSIGVYYILKDNDIYIGSTFKLGFRKRFLAHKNDKKSQGYKLLKDGGMFNILYKSDVEDEYLIRKMEDILINYFREHSEFNVINEAEPFCKYDIEANRKLFKKKKYNMSKNKYIKVDKKDYNKAIEILKDNGISIVE